MTDGAEPTHFENPVSNQAFDSVHHSGRLISLIMVDYGITADHCAEFEMDSSDFMFENYYASTSRLFCFVQMSLADFVSKRDSLMKASTGKCFTSSSFKSFGFVSTVPVSLQETHQPNLTYLSFEHSESIEDALSLEVLDS